MKHEEYNDGLMSEIFTIPLGNPFARPKAPEELEEFNKSIQELVKDVK